LKLLLILVSVVALFGWLAIGMFVAQGPQPEIIVPAEVITSFGAFNITNTMITAWTVMATMILMSVVATRSMKLLPSGYQNFMEATIEYLVDQVVAIAGEKNGRKFFMVIATFFLFIIMSNWLALLPFFNAIGQTEDVGFEVFEAIAEHAESGAEFKESESLAAWIVDDTGGIGLVKPGAEDTEFEIEAGWSAGQALDAYIVFLAVTFTDFESVAADGEGELGVSAEELESAIARLDATEGAPVLISGEAEEGHEGVESAALGPDLTLTAIGFPDQKLALIIPYFRSVYSDVNNTLALAFLSFLIVEFWGFQALGGRYLGKFFVNPIRNPIGTFVGILELVSEFIRIVSFTFRLFGNIFAGEVLILMLTFLMPFLIVDIIYGLELFVGFIQAAVFALLTLVFAVMATEHHGDGDGEHGEAHD
jgi:F-type H+-transporting ATPase subunit a